MRRLCALALTGALLVAPTAWAQDHVTFEALTVDDTSGGVRIAVTTIRPTGRPPQLECLARLETAQIRYRYDGTAPSTTVGTLWEVGEEKKITGPAYLDAFRAIRTGATSGTLTVHCYARTTS